MALSLNQQVMMMHHLKLTLKHEKNIEKALIEVMPLLPKKFQKKVRRMTYHMQQGYKMEEVMQLHKNVFHPFVIQTLSLLHHQKYYDVIIDQTIKHLYLLQKRIEMKKKSTRYPMILSIIIVMVMIGFIAFLLPFIKQMYRNFNIEPSPLLILIDTIIFYIEINIISIILVLLLSIGMLLFVYFHQNIRRFLYHIFYRKLRMLTRFQLSFYTRFFTFMQLMLLEKRPIFEVFVDLTKRFNKTVFEKDLKIILIEIQSGRAFTSIFEASPIFNHVIANLFHQAQSNDQIQAITLVLSEYYYEELMMRDQQFYALIEPILIALLSVFVGLIAFMIYEPLLSMYEGL